MIGRSAGSLQVIVKLEDPIPSNGGAGLKLGLSRIREAEDRG
jgi:hypothetical protein